jgi:hypothetical protein
MDSGGVEEGAGAVSSSQTLEEIFSGPDDTRSGVDTVGGGGTGCLNL